MIINGTLKEQLYRYINTGYNEDYPKSMGQTKTKREETAQLIQELELKREEYNKIDNHIDDTCAAYERQGFLRGYEYCLKMMGLIGR